MRWWMSEDKIIKNKFGEIRPKYRKFFYWNEHPAEIPHPNCKCIYCHNKRIQKSRIVHENIKRLIDMEG